MGQSSFCVKRCVYHGTESFPYETQRIAPCKYGVEQLAKAQGKHKSGHSGEPGDAGADPKRQVMI